MAYERINWQNGEVGNTPLNANNLNRMDMAIEEHEQKIGDHDYEIENLKTGAQGITEELNKKMDRINPQGSGTFSIPAVNADNITAQTVEADEIKVTKVGSKGGTAPVVFDNDILVNGITTPIGSLASSASSKAESAERTANEADREAGTARTIASTAYSRVQENIFRTDKLEGIVGGGVGELSPQFTYYDGKYLRPDGAIADYNNSAKVIEFEINKNSDSGCNVIFKNVDLIPIDASILCGFYNAAGILLGEEMRGLIIMADFDEDTGKMTRQYISYCVVPAPYYAKYVRISGIANGAVDIAIQNTLSDAVAELQSRSTSALVLTNPSPLPATYGNKILGIDAKGNSTQNGTPTPTSPIPIIDASAEVTAIGKNLFNPINVFNGHTNDATINANANARLVYAKCKPNTTYTISKKSGQRFQVAYTSEIPSLGVPYYGKINTPNASSISITVGADAKYVIAFVWLSSADTTISANDMLATVQIEEGTTATSYVPYQSNTITLPYTLLSVGTVADELIANEDGSGKKKVNVYEFVPNAQNCVDATPLQGDGCKRLAFKLDHLLQTGVAIEGLSNLYSNIDTSTYSALKYGQMSLRQGNASTSYVRLTFPNECTTTAECLAYLSDCKIYYPLPTPTEIPLTSEEVASIRQLQTYKGTTVIDSEMQIESVTYSGDVKAYVDSKTDYSYTDQIIGKWADGKDLHRMVIQTNTPSSTALTPVFSGFNSNTAELKNIGGCIKGTATAQIPINCYINPTYYAGTWLDASGICMSVASAYTSKPCEIIVEYTLKNTATASVMSLDETEE